MKDQELIARLRCAPGDFVTLDHEQARRCREALQQRLGADTAMAIDKTQQQEIERP